ncbi:MAG: galactokinase, partial [Clostridia bacterium]
PEETGTTAALIRGVTARMQALGHPIGGFDAVVTSNVLNGSGLSSSAAFEVLICTILDGLYHTGEIDPCERAKIAQYAENVYFGKPSGLMDQMASSVGGLVHIDFRHTDAVVRPLAYDFAAQGYALVVVNTGGSHDDLTADYAAIRTEMEQVAAFFGDKVLRNVRPEQVENGIAALREKVSDRAILRALHFFDDNQRVSEEVQSLKQNDL